MKPEVREAESRSFFDKRNIQLVLLVVISSASLIVINYYSLKLTSAVRAFTNGESHYSKAQKDASVYLIAYLTIGDSSSWRAFEEELNVPIGDSLARIGMMYDSSYAYIRAGYLQGRNHEDDIKNQIWLFKTFQETYFMKDAIQLWTEADVLIGQLKKMGDEIHQKRHLLNHDEKDIILKRINELTSLLSIKERKFSDQMGQNARKINITLLTFNVFCTLLTISVVVSYAYKGYKRLFKMQGDLRRSNKDLVSMNQELDNFIYAASHDLKSPINNLEGLIMLWQMEADASLNSSSGELRKMMKLSISRLRKTIDRLTELMKTDKSPMEDIEENSLENILNEFWLENNYLLQEAGAEIDTDFQVSKVRYSKMGIKSIVQNLLTNAIKYRSPDRKCNIQIKSYLEGERVVLQVSDNGLGMDLVKNKDRLFKMFNRLHDHVEGTGVGLYMIKKIIEKQGGNIFVDSQPNEGTTFSVSLN